MKSENVYAIRMLHRNRTWTVPVALDSDTKGLFEMVYSVEPYKLRPYYMGKICRRGHDHYGGLSMRRWSDTWCVECQTNHPPKFVEAILGPPIQEILFSNENPETVDM